MFDIPFELFITWLMLSFGLMAITFARDPRAPIFMMVAGILMFPMVALTDNVIMGYASSGGSVTITETETPIAIFSDDYSTNDGWTQVGTGITVDNADNNQVSFSNVANGATDRRVYKSLNATIIDPQWSANFEWSYSAAATALHPIFGLTSGNARPTPTSSNQDGVFFYEQGTGVDVRYKDGSGSVTACSTQITVTTGVTYYTTIERLDLDSLKLSIYSDSDRTNHLGGSPKVCAIPMTVNGFSYIQHSVSDSGTGTLTAIVDNTEITGIDVETVITTEGASVATPILFEFTEWVKILFGLYGTMLIFIGSLIYKGTGNSQRG